MKALVVYDPKSKFTLEALKAVEYKLAEFENLELVYVADHNHERMENPKEYNLKMEKEGPEWITPEPEVMEQIKDADILMTSFCGVTRAMLEAGKNLKLVFMMRSGWENCNVKAAKELGIPFVDLNTTEGKNAINWKKDTRDGGRHLNCYGAKKVTREIGKYISENYTFTNKKKDPEYKSWNKAYREYKQFMKTDKKSSDKKHKKSKKADIKQSDTSDTKKQKTEKTTTENKPETTTESTATEEVTESASTEANTTLQ